MDPYLWSIPWATKFFWKNRLQHHVYKIRNGVVCHTGQRAKPNSDPMTKQSISDVQLIAWRHGLVSVKFHIVLYHRIICSRISNACNHAFLFAQTKQLHYIIDFLSVRQEQRFVEFLLKWALTFGSQSDAEELWRKAGFSHYDSFSPHEDQKISYFCIFRILKVISN